MTTALLCALLMLSLTRCGSRQVYPDFDCPDVDLRGETNEAVWIYAVEAKAALEICQARVDAHKR